ncbi:3',5'-cyclic AMP phosphodiesterase CpdA [Prosthecobacter fusiformis]|uniref:3',5'-cyclic AMP phosphodiesterase CpdA n=1 Tax=Prosthecobacter fusiformis TaxID=48464 RepID=A0A4R7SRH4_9BACT|nr:metallophosphoesterase [Prosthecobacter fusiformis]TDU81056.1 3',5'-cyclic AMP phosphodiesterase CpdA [Prosthecobacter fusiformis]
MPISLPALTRRQWIQGSLAAMLTPTWAEAADKQAPNETWALFSDTHILADPKAEARGVIMADNLTRCANQVLKLASKPYGVLVNGDCAFLKGEQPDYATFIGLIQPLREAGIPVHCTLGNHDDRKNFTGAMTTVQDPRPVEGRHVSVFSSATMNWVLLDTLDQVNKTPGLLGDLQLGWLDRTLASLPAKPTVVMAHHNPQQPLTAEGQKHTGMMDSEALFKVLAKHKRVKAFVYGHTHNWSHTRDEVTGIHLINLPPVAYVFGPDRPNGWVIARASAEKLEFELRALNPAHAQHGEKVEVLWES